MTSHSADQALPNFAEMFWTNSYQPFAEYEFHPFKKFTITPGVKFAYYTVATKQFADDGKTIGGLGTNNPASFITNGGNYYSTLYGFDDRGNEDHVQDPTGTITDTVR